jgi:hypothetical protein
MVIPLIKLSSASTVIEALSDCSTTRSIAFATILLKSSVTALFSVVTLPLPVILSLSYSCRKQIAAVNSTNMNFVISVIILIMIS